MIPLLVVLALADVRVVELEPQRAIVTTVSAKPAELSAAITTAVLTLLQTADGASGPPFARYQSRTDARVVVEIGLPVRKAPAVKKPIRVIDLPGGQAAELVFVGRHEDLPKAHAQLDAWLEREKRVAIERWEVYETNPITTPDPKRQQTRIVARLRQRDGS